MVFFIDDADLPTKYYIDEFEAANELCRHISSINEIDSSFESEMPSAIVVDIMMPPGDRYSDEESDGGLNTGSLLIQEIREKLPELPICVLTNVSGVEELRQELGPDDDLLRIESKARLLPEELLMIVQGMIGKHSQ